MPKITNIISNTKKYNEKNTVTIINLQEVMPMDLFFFLSCMTLASGSVLGYRLKMNDIRSGISSTHLNSTYRSAHHGDTVVCYCTVAYRTLAGWLLTASSSRDEWHALFVVEAAAVSLACTPCRDVAVVARWECQKLIVIWWRRRHNRGVTQLAYLPRRRPTPTIWPPCRAPWCVDMHADRSIRLWTQIRDYKDPLLHGRVQGWVLGSLTLQSENPYIVM